MAGDWADSRAGPVASAASVPLNVSGSSGGSSGITIAEIAASSAKAGLRLWTWARTASDTPASNARQSSARMKFSIRIGVEGSRTIDLSISKGLSSRRSSVEKMRRSGGSGRMFRRCGAKDAVRPPRYPSRHHDLARDLSISGIGSTARFRVFSPSRSCASGSAASAKRMACSSISASGRIWPSSASRRMTVGSRIAMSVRAWSWVRGGELHAGRGQRRAPARRSRRPAPRSAGIRRRRARRRRTSRPPGTLRFRAAAHCRASHSSSAAPRPPA